MSSQALGWALDQDLPVGPKLVLVAIANHADHSDGYCHFRGEVIAHEASSTRLAVARWVAALVRNGYLRCEQKRDSKRRIREYWILFNRQPASWHWQATDAADESRDDERFAEESASLAEQIAKRNYTPPIAPMAATETVTAPPVFVIEGTRAWDAWLAYRRRVGRPVNFSYGGEGEHRGKTGRHFPTLFPPPATSSPDLNTADDRKFLEQGGLK